MKFINALNHDFSNRSKGEIKFQKLTKQLEIYLLLLKS